jgi:hypothetical protein
MYGSSYMFRHYIAIFRERSVRNISAPKPYLQATIHHGKYINNAITVNTECVNNKNSYTHNSKVTTKWLLDRQQESSALPPPGRLRTGSGGLLRPSREVQNIRSLLTLPYD